MMRKGAGKGRGPAARGGARAWAPRTAAATSGGAGGDKRKCHWCGNGGHLIKDCRSKRDGKPRKVQTRGANSLEEAQEGDYSESMSGRDCGSISLADCGTLSTEDTAGEFYWDYLACGTCGEGEKQRMAEREMLGDASVDPFELEWDLKGGVWPADEDYELDEEVETEAAQPLVIGSDGWPLPFGTDLDFVYFRYRADLAICVIGGVVRSPLETVHIRDRVQGGPLSC